MVVVVEVEVVDVDVAAPEVVGEEIEAQVEVVRVVDVEVGEEARLLRPQQARQGKETFLPMQMAVLAILQRHLGVRIKRQRPPNL